MEQPTTYLSGPTIIIWWMNSRSNFDHRPLCELWYSQSLTSIAHATMSKIPRRKIHECYFPSLSSDSHGDYNNFQGILINRFGNHSRRSLNLRSSKEGEPLVILVENEGRHAITMNDFKVISHFCPTAGFCIHRYFFVAVDDRKWPDFSNQTTSLTSLDGSTYSLVIQSPLPLTSLGKYLI